MLPRLVDWVPAEQRGGAVQRIHRTVGRLVRLCMVSKLIEAVGAAPARIRALRARVA